MPSTSVSLSVRKSCASIIAAQAQALINEAEQSRWFRTTLSTARREFLEANPRFVEYLRRYRAQAEGFADINRDMARTDSDVRGAGTYSEVPDPFAQWEALDKHVERKVLAYHESTVLPRSKRGREYLDARNNILYAPHAVDITVMPEATKELMRRAALDSKVDRGSLFKYALDAQSQ